MSEEDGNCKHNEDESFTRAEADDFDTVLKQIGLGKWNAIYYVAVAYWHVCLPYHTLAGAFISPAVNHTCLPPPRAFSQATARSVPHNASTNTSGVIPLYDNSCSYLQINNATGIPEEVPCTNWYFDTSTFSSTVTSEFGLVCDRRYLRAAHQSIYMSGILVGAFLNGFLADRYGRLRMITISVMAYTVVAIGSAWLPSLELLLAGRFLLGMLHPTSLNTGFILVMEITEIKWRSTIALTTQNLWSVGAALWGLFAYLERDWRWLQTYVSLLCPLMFPILLFMKESPRWLMVMGRHKEALSVLQQAARINGTSLPPTERLLPIMKKVQQQSSNKTEGSLVRRVLDRVTILFRTKKLVTVTVCICIGFFSTAMIFFGLTLGASTLNMNPFAYMAISGAVELVSFITICIVELYGRKKSGIGTCFICALCLLLQPLIPASRSWLSITLVMVGKMVASCAFDIMFLYTSELYPTEMRTQGLSAGMMASRVGAFIAPFIITALEVHHSWAISVVFGLMASVAAMSFLPLWETRNTCLPDTMKQLHTRTVVSTHVRGDSRTRETASYRETTTSC